MAFRNESEPRNPAWRSGPKSAIAKVLGHGQDRVQVLLEVPNYFKDLWNSRTSYSVTQITFAQEAEPSPRLPILGGHFKSTRDNHRGIKHWLSREGLSTNSQALNQPSFSGLRVLKARPGTEKSFFRASAPLQLFPHSHEDVTGLSTLVLHTTQRPGGRTACDSYNRYDEKAAREIHSARSQPNLTEQTKRSGKYRFLSQNSRLC